MRHHNLHLFLAAMTLVISLQAGAWTPEQENIDGKIAAAQEGWQALHVHPKMAIANNLYKQILILDEEIATRADMRFSEDLDKGEASSNMKAASQYSFLAGEIIREIKVKETLTSADYDLAIRQLREIKTELKKINQ